MQKNLFIKALNTSHKEKQLNNKSRVIRFFKYKKNILFIPVPAAIIERQVRAAHDAANYSRRMRWCGRGVPQLRHRVAISTDDTAPPREGDPATTTRYVHIVPCTEFWIAALINPKKTVFGEECEEFSHMHENNNKNCAPADWGCRCCLHRRAPSSPA